MNQFARLGLSPKVIAVLDKIGFHTPTPIQEQAIPLLLDPESSDFIGLAQTGTGKTAAFGLPLIDLIDMEDKSTQVLIMAPTRELGQQTAKQLTEFASEDADLNVECVYGGSSIVAQMKALKKPVQIIVATPGRLLDLMRRKAVNLEQVRYVVLDEADEMLNMGFKEDIDLILEATPEERVTWLFSATMPKDIRRLVKKYMDKPKEVAVNTEHKTNLDITHQYVVTKVADKVAALRRFLDLDADMRGILFCRTRRETQKIADDLGDLGYAVEALHGELSQAQRDNVMKRFKNRGMQLLVATDVAARGIDVNDLTHVLHHTLPDQLESYTHRSGRTGRAGKKGISLAFINSREQRKIKSLESRIGITFERVSVPSIDEVKSIRFTAWAKEIVKTPAAAEAYEVSQEVSKIFGGLEKEDLIQKLISIELKKLAAETIGGDLNDNSTGKRGSKNPEANRFFINVGMMDGLTEPELIGFLLDFSNIQRDDLSNIHLSKKCAFFDLKKGKEKGFAEAFSGLEVDGRAIRVNREEEEGSDAPRKKGKYGRGKKDYGNSSYRGKGKGRHSKQKRKPKVYDTAKSGKSKRNKKRR